MSLEFKVETVDVRISCLKQFATIAVLLLVAVACRAGSQKSLPFFAVDPSTSPRMSALRSAVDNGDGAAVVQFWDGVREKHSPLIEPVPNDNHRSLVTFVWKGNADTHNVVVIGGVAGTELTKNLLSNIRGTDVWYKTYNVRNDARFIYSLSPNDSLQPIEKIDPKDRKAMRKRLSDLRQDPFNPKDDPGGMPASYVELASAPPQRWIEPVQVAAKGTLEKQEFYSSILGNKRDIWVYTPAGFSRIAGRYNLLVVFDGADYISDVPTPVILDNLISKRLIPPTVSVFVGNPTDSSRAVELPCSPQFADFLAAELVPWMRKNYDASAIPTDAAVAGSSFGGLAAAFAGFRHPEIFGNVLSQSGSFWWKPDGQTQPEWLTKEFANAPRSNMRFFLEAGLMETGPSLTGPSILAANRHLRDVLLGKRYRLHYQEFNGGHEVLNWRGTFADGLMYLFGRDQNR